MLLTVGEKIKYYRKRYGLTQRELSERSGINPTTIRKYEANTMKPKLQQVQRLAEAMEIGANALFDDDVRLQCENMADFYGLMLLFLRSGLIKISGDRDEYGRIIPETMKVYISSSPMLKNFMSLEISDGYIQINDEEVKQNISNLELSHYLREEILAHEEEGRDAVGGIFNESLMDISKKLELELQAGQRRINVVERKK